VTLVLSTGQVCASIEKPALGKRQVVLRTDFGDLLLGLYPDHAPQTVAYFLELVEGGLYDTTHFYRVVPGYLTQVSLPTDRLIPIVPSQRRLLRSIPFEKNALLHKRLRIAMARPGGTVSGGEGSFYILLGDAPHLDGQYTVFGEVLHGKEAVDSLPLVRTDGAGRPLHRVGIRRAEAVQLDPGLLRSSGFGPEFAALRLAPASRTQPEVPFGWDTLLRGWPMLAGLLLIVLSSLAIAVWGRRLGPTRTQSLAFFACGVAAFLVVCAVLPIAGVFPQFGITLFCVILVGVFLFGGFEPA
jgi:cyclophilin family peptidyl-prolyl cis-trans isomerase